MQSLKTANSRIKAHALIGVAQWVGYHSNPKRKDAIWIRGWGACLGCRPSPSSGEEAANQCFSHIDVSPPSPLSKINK